MEIERPRNAQQEIEEAIPAETPEERERRIQALVGPRNLDEASPKPENPVVIDEAPARPAREIPPAEILQAEEPVLETPVVPAEPSPESLLEKEPDLQSEIETKISRADVDKKEDPRRIILAQEKLQEATRAELKKLIDEKGPSAHEVKLHLIKNANDAKYMATAAAELLKATGKTEELLAENKQLEIPSREKPLRAEELGSLETLVSIIKDGKEVLVDRYNITGYVGEGMAFYVLKAHHQELDDSVPVALKLPKTTDCIPLLKRHKEFLLKLRPGVGIPDILDAKLKEEGELCYVAEQYLDGPTLEKLIQEHREKGEFIEESQATRYAFQLITTLEHIHKKGIVHKDLKPLNILISGGMAYITDFDVSDGIMAPIQHTMLTQTLSSSINGFTPLYASPEQLEKKPVDKRSDLYSLALTLFQMLTNQVHIGSDINPKTFNKSLKNEYSAFFTKALKAKPEERYQTAREMLEAFQAVVGKKEAKREESKYGGGVIVYLERNKIHKASLDDSDLTPQTIYELPSGTSRIWDLKDFCVSPDRKQIAVLLTEQFAKPLPVRVVACNIDSPKDERMIICEYTGIQGPDKISWNPEGIHVYNHLGDALCKQGWWRWIMNKQQFEYAGNKLEKQSVISSPNGKYQLFKGQVGGVSGLYIVASNESSLELPKRAAFVTEEDLKSYTWINTDAEQKTKRRPFDWLIEVFRRAEESEEE